MSGKKCKHCGSSDIEVDPARGDAVCTNCGTVLEDNIIVAEVEFVANTHGGASAMGQFVSADTKGGATGFGGAFNAGIGQESREVTLKRARNGITALCQQLRLNQQCIDIACNFFKMALSRHLTNGRPASHIQAACVYITCRTEGTAHLLIDISDVLQICCYQLGRTYFRLSRALCINIPSVDPCLYVLRFASQLQFGDKKHEVSMTALRLVQRMKRDSIHSGRRPSGLCGAALLIAARLHDFCRTPSDVVRIVKVHETTLRKRLLEFGDTPSSALTLDEFMTVDLEEEQDPPAFRAARKRDKERLHKLIEEEDGEKELTELQREIDKQLEKDNSKRKKIAALTPQLIETVVGAGDEPVTAEDCEASRFAAEDTLSLIDEITQDINKKDSNNMKLEKQEKGLAPDLAVMGLTQTEEKVQDKFVKPEPKCAFNKDLYREEELRLSDKDEEYVDSMIMSDAETRHKTVLWNKINAGYLKEQKIKEEVRAREREEGKDKKKKVRGSYRKKVPLNAATAGEAIEKMLQEKRMSTKINYDILKSLDQSGAPATAGDDPLGAKIEVQDVKINPKLESTSSLTSSQPTTLTTETIVETSPIPRKRSRKSLPAPALVLGSSPAPGPATPLAAPSTPSTPAPQTPIRIEGADDEEEDLELEAEAEVPEVTNEMSIAAMLQGGNDEEDYDYEEY